MIYEPIYEKIRHFAKNGGVVLHVVALCPGEENPTEKDATRDKGKPSQSEKAKNDGCDFLHWGGFMTTSALELQPGPIVRPDPPYLIVSNGPRSRESSNQQIIEEVVQWNADNSIKSTVIIYKKME